MKPVALWLAALFVVACAAVPRPRILGEVEATRRGAAARHAEQLAPQAHAHAEKLRARADQAFSSGDRAGAQLLGEHALAAYAHAFVLARLVKAEKEVVREQTRLAKAEQELARLDEQQRRLASEADALELRVKVATDALPLTPNAPSGPEREQARREAATTYASQARLLCTSARLLDPKLGGLDTDFSKLDALDKALLSKAPVPIDEAIALRSACLKRLTLVRRPARQTAPAAGRDDTLLTELSQTGQFAPFRDDRGVVVVLRGLFGAANKLAGGADERLGLLGRIAKAHADFPVLVVVHAAAPSAGDRDTRRGELVSEALRKAGATRVEVRVAGAAQPVLEPSRAGSAARNERIEIVFISPS